MGRIHFSRIVSGPFTAPAHLESGFCSRGIKKNELTGKGYELIIYLYYYYTLFILSTTIKPVTVDILIRIIYFI